MPKLKVHIFTVVRIPVVLEAATAADALAKAQEVVNFYSVPGAWPGPDFNPDCKDIPRESVQIGEAEWAEEHAYFLVDEVDEENQLINEDKSQWFNTHEEPVSDTGLLMPAKLEVA